MESLQVAAVERLRKKKPFNVLNEKYIVKKSKIHTLVPTKKAKILANNPFFDY